jgi:hypothetical protein
LGGYDLLTFYRPKRSPRTLPIISPALTVADSKKACCPILASILGELLPCLVHVPDMISAITKSGRLMRRVQRRMHLLQIDDMAAFLDRLRQDGREVTLLFQDLLIGTTLIERALTHELDAEVRREFAVTGLRCTIEIPLTEEVGRRRPGLYNQGDAMSQDGPSGVAYPDGRRRDADRRSDRGNAARSGLPCCGPGEQAWTPR